MHLFPQLSATTPHVQSGGLEAWVVRPLGIATVLRGHVTYLDVRALTDGFTEELLAFAADEGSSVRFLHDWRALKTYEPRARLEFIDWGRRIGAARIERIDILTARQNPLPRMGIMVGASALSIVGIRLNVHESFTAMVSVGASTVAPHPRWSESTPPE